jgi:hypothetical protein
MKVKRLMKGMLPHGKEEEGDILISREHVPSLFWEVKFLKREKLKMAVGLAIPVQ